MAQIIRLSTITLKRLSLALPNLLSVSFYLLDTFCQTFSKINSLGRLLHLFFVNETSGKIEHMIFLVLLENQGNAKEGIILSQKKNVFRHKKSFSSNFAQFEGVPFWKGITLWRHISKSRKVNNLKFCVC